MALPLSRNDTYVSGQVLDSQTVNDLQDSVVGAKHGGVEKPIDLAGSEYVNASFLTGSGYVQASAAAAVVVKGLTLTVGDQITSISFQHQGSGTVTMRLYRVALGVRTEVDNVSATAGGSWATASKTLSAPGHTVTTGGSYQLSFELANSGARVQSPSLGLQHP